MSDTGQSPPPPASPPPASPPPASPPPASPPAAPPPPADPVAQFHAMLPEDIRGEASFKDIKDVAGLARSYHNGQKLLGVPQDRIVRLPDGDDPAAWNPIYDRLGRPESADKYALTDPQDVPQELVSPEGKALFAKLAHEHGLSNKQADALYQHFNTRQIDGFKKAMAEIAKSVEQVETTLKGELGQAYDQDIGQMNLLIDHLSRQFNLGDKLKNAIDGTGGENGIAVRKALIEVGKLMAEHELIGRATGGQGGMMSPTEARQQINAKTEDAAFMAKLKNASAAGHQAALDEWLKLHEFLSPAAAAAA